MPRSRPLNAARLDELALHYVGKFATSRGKLAAYLARKIRERGWEDERPADIDALVERLAGYGYVDDAAYAAMKGRSLAARGYGERRLGQALAAARIGEDDGEGARAAARDNAEEVALRFAAKRRIGPFGDGAADRATREKWIAAMVRAGHPADLSRRIASARPEDDSDAAR